MKERPIDDHGGSAFPHDEGERLHADPGMSLRDWFAGQALAGLMSDVRAVGMLNEIANWRGIEANDAVAQNAYALADAMLKERGA